MNNRGCLRRVTRFRKNTLGSQTQESLNCTFFKRHRSRILPVLSWIKCTSCTQQKTAIRGTSWHFHGHFRWYFQNIAAKNFLPSPYSALTSLISLDAFSWDSDFHLHFEIDFDLNYAQDFHDHDFPLWMAVSAHSQVDNYILVDSHRLVADNHIQVDNIHKVVDSHRLVGDTWDLAVDSNTDWDGAEAYHRHAHSRLYSCRRLAHKGCQVFGAPGSVTAGENGEEIFSFLGASWFLFFSFSSEARHLCISSPASHSSWMTQQLSNCMPYQDSDSSAHPLDTCGSEHSPATKKQLQLV